MATVRLFVYGSLKRDGRHHEELRGARFLAEARTAPGFTLVTLTLGAASYCALVPSSESGESVAGELFELPADLLPALDEFEGNSYERGEVPLSGAGEGAGAGEGEGAGSGRALAYFKKSR